MSYFERDALDDLFYSWALESAPELASLEHALGPDLLRDLHASLLRSTLTPSGETPAHATQVREITGTPEHASLRAECQGDESRALLGTLALARALKGKLAPKAPQKPQRGLALDAGDAARQAGREACAFASGEVREAVLASEQLLGAGGSGAGTAGPSPRKSDRAGLLKARDAIGRSRKRGLVAAILEQAGRMTQIARSVRAAKSRRGPGAIVGVEQAGDVARALPSELVALCPGAHPGLRLDFLKRLQAREVSCRKMEASENVGRGPIVLCMDQSGSMSGSREIWAKGLALTLLRLASEDGRAFAFVPFAHGVGRTWRFDAGSTPGPDVLLSMLESFLDGGTDFQAPLDEALTLLESSELRKADVVFLTDGQAYLDPTWEASWRARADAKGARVWSILVECGEGTPCSLDGLSAGTARVPRLDLDGDALEMALSVGLT